MAADTRLLTITSTLPSGALVPTRLSVVESLGEPYAIEVDVLGDDAGMLPKDLLTKPIAVAVRQPMPGSPLIRHFHGLVVEWQRLGPGAAGRTAYRLVAVPGLWRLGLRENCRVFQDKSVKDIVTAVLAEHEQPAPNWGILPALSPIPYCTQFNETDLAFVSRLLEEHGLTYYFAHTASSHVLHISATAPGFRPFEGGDVAVVHGSALAAELSSWSRTNQARSSVVELDDMDVERSKPTVVLTKRSQTRAFDGEPAMWGAGKVRHWPGGMSTRTGLDPAAVAMGARESASEQFEGESVDPRFTAGVRMSISVRDEGGSEAKQPYVVTAVRHEAGDSSGLVAGTGGTEYYKGTLQLVSSQRTWMPAARHPRPVMGGVYSAKVTGPSGEQIHVDEFGRIKVRFRWDTTGPDTDASSCWVRVAQAAAGAWGGAWFLPRVGDEVLVSFLDGDPDRPVVIGSVYGKDAKPPFDPGANRSQSGISTRSYKSSSASDSNVLRFEDKKGNEEILLHAQKDLKVEVENDETRSVDHDQTETIKNSRTTTISDADDKLTLTKGNRQVDIKQGNDGLKLDQGNRKVEIKMGNDDLKLDQGNLTVKCSLGSVMIEAMQKITLKVGESSLVIDQTGITAKGTLITSEAQGIHKTKAPLVQVEASGLAIVKGGVVMIN